MEVCFYLWNVLVPFLYCFKEGGERCLCCCHNLYYYYYNHHCHWYFCYYYCIFILIFLFVIVYVCLSVSLFVSLWGNVCFVSNNKGKNKQTNMQKAFQPYCFFICVCFFSPSLPYLQFAVHESSHMLVSASVFLCGYIDVSVSASTFVSYRYICSVYICLCLCLYLCMSVGKYVLMYFVSRLRISKMLYLEPYLRKWKCCIYQSHTHTNGD